MCVGKQYVKEIFTVILLSYLPLRLPVIPEYLEFLLPAFTEHAISIKAAVHWCPPIKESLDKDFNTILD